MIEDEFPRYLAKRAVLDALIEDLGMAGDITGNAVISPDEEMTCQIRARESGVIAGLPLAIKAFHTQSDRLEIKQLMFDGQAIKAGDVLMRITGQSRAILSAERVALNYLGHLTGIASLTAKFVEKTKGTKAAICCTRKTLPGLRAFQKYAVRAGGGQNHRYGLDDAVLIKDNHIASAGGISQVLDRVAKNVGHMVKVEIEVDSLEQLKEVLEYKVDAVLLDNMDPATLRKAVEMIDGRAIAESSGGVNLETVAKIAQSGVDLISVGALTHSAAVLDLGLDYD